MGSADAALNHLFGEFSKQQAAFSKAQSEITELSVSEDGPRHLFTVVIGNGGEVRELTFHSRDYRDLGPEDLSTMIVETIAKAQKKLRDQIQASFASVTSRADTMAGMLSEDFDWSTLMPNGLGGTSEATQQAAPKKKGTTT